jgi:hypothetical protein
MNKIERYHDKGEIGSINALKDYVNAARDPG